MLISLWLHHWLAQAIQVTTMGLTIRIVKVCLVVGQIPMQGRYRKVNTRLGPQQDNITNTGVELPGSMRLTPDRYNNMLDRNGFLIHGGNMSTQTSSQGCIVMSKKVRDAIGSSGDNVLWVIP